jgi:hypothetical protein
LTITRREGSDGVGPHRFDPVSIATVGLVALDLPASLAVRRRCRRRDSVSTVEDHDVGQRV